MAANIFTVPEVQGSKRTSPRNYTHAIIGKYNHEAAIERAMQPVEVDASNYAYHAMVAAMHDGDGYTVTGCAKPWTRYIKQEDIDSSKEWIAPYTSAEAYCKHMQRIRVEAAVFRKECEQEGGDYRVLQWSMSYANALKGCGAYRYNFIDIKVVETVKVK